MTGNRGIYILSALGAALLLAAFCLWRFDSFSRGELDRVMRQYGQTRTLIASYQRLSSQARPEEKRREGNLFAWVNQLGSELNLSSRIEALRPSEGKEGGENLDLQIRGLYLGEFLRFLQGVESLEDTRVDRLSLNKTAAGLLDLEMKISRHMSEAP